LYGRHEPKEKKKTITKHGGKMLSDLNQRDDENKYRKDQKKNGIDPKRVIIVVVSSRQK
jgi:hypothetical protein